MHASAAPDSDIVAAVKQGLRETGYVDVIVEYRSAEDRYDRLLAIAPSCGDLNHRNIEWSEFNL